MTEGLRRHTVDQREARHQLALYEWLSAALAECLRPAQIAELLVNATGDFIGQTLTGANLEQVLDRACAIVRARALEAAYQVAIERTDAAEAVRPAGPGAGRGRTEPPS